MKRLITLLCTVAAFFTACSNPSNQPQSGEKYQGREKTKKIEGASAVGYDGTAIRKSVDNTLNKNDDRNQDLDKAMKSAADTQQKQ